MLLWNWRMIWGFLWGVRFSRACEVIKKKKVISGGGVIPFWFIIGSSWVIYIYRESDADERNCLCVWVLNCN